MFYKRNYNKYLIDWLKLMYLIIILIKKTNHSKNIQHQNIHKELLYQIVLKKNIYNYLKLKNIVG